jgi:hypothetical protein
MDLSGTEADTVLVGKSQSAECKSQVSVTNPKYRAMGAYRSELLLLSGQHRCGRFNPEEGWANNRARLHLSIPYTGMEPTGKCRHPIGSSYSVQQWRFGVVRLSNLIYIKYIGPLFLRLV